MRRADDVVFVDTSSIEIEILETSVSNFERVGMFRSNPLVPFTATVMDQIFEEQRRNEEVSAERFDNERNIKTVKNSFMSNFEAFCRGMGLQVI
ncbi:MAG: hypothetical protein FWE20_05625 [Defluviitaleaceae bacterium]|nr:hypothetical protein [Defluviitaleaceae bacterium]